MNIDNKEICDALDKILQSVSRLTLSIDNDKLILDKIKDLHLKFNKDDQFGMMVRKICREVF